MKPVFKYFQFVVWNDVIIGRPANTFKKVIRTTGGEMINPIYRDFEDFASEMTFGIADDNIKPGLYDRDDIELKLIGNNRFYLLKQLTHGNADF